MTTPAHPQILNLALLGYGKMGKAIAALAPQRGCKMVCVLDDESNRNYEGITAENFKDAKVVLEFTTPGAVVENVRRVAALGCDLVVGTTGWTDRLDEARRAIESSGTGMVYGANFSIGVHLFYRTAAAMAKILSAYPVYEPYVVEAHHHLKKDAPSGTALELTRRIKPLLAGREIPLASLRAGYIPGTHEIGFDSEADTLVLRHTARSRQGFAEGALHAARWVAGRRGLFQFADTLDYEGATHEP